MRSDMIDRKKERATLLTPEQQRILKAPGMTVGQLEDRNAARLKKARERKVREGKIRDLLKARIEAYGGEQRAVSWLGRSNAPDVLALFPAGSDYDVHMAIPDDACMHPWIETKRPTKAATEAQAREHERMRAAGCVVLVVTCEQELDAWLPPL